MFQSVQKFRFVPLQWIPGVLKLVLLSLFVCSPCWAQITNVTDTTSTPVPGAGHDYLGILNETVNPANGSLSVRISTPVPPGRKLTVPFSFAYDSNGTVILQPSFSDLFWATPLLQTTWQNVVPTLSYSMIKVPNVPGGIAYCWVAYDYVYQDASGGRHPLYLSIYGPATGRVDCSGAVMPDGFTVVTATNGGDGIVQGYTPAIPSGQAFTMQKVWVTDADGTVVTFTPTQLNGNYTVVPDTIEDRNGNVVTVNHPSPPTVVNSYTDTLGRASVSLSYANPETISVSGVNNYTAAYGSQSASGSGLTINQFSGSCPVRGLGEYSLNQLTTLTLPNGKTYQFFYEPNWGMLSKIVYPTGGYVSYTWGVNHNSEAGQDSGADGTTTFSCQYDYDTPVVTDRYVSFDGSTQVLHQTFAYTTTWEADPSLYSQKTTKVTTYDLVRGGNFQTVYTYSGQGVQPQPNAAEYITTQTPVESQIQYNDWASNGGGILKTVNKTWNFVNPNEMTCESTTLGSLTSRTDYTYASTMALVTDKKEWDWGTAPVCGNSTSGTPLRETVTNYNSFTTPIFAGGPSIFDKPSQVTVYGSGTQIAQTTYAYTESVSSAGVTTGRDSNYNANSGIARGNASTVTRWLNTGGSSPVTTYAYDDTGQVTSMIDPLNNTTSYGYSNNNAYLATVTYPNTGVAHTESYTYNNSTGEVASSTDENLNPTSYQYNDPFARLTETDYPDGGQTKVSYNDTPTTPSVTTSKELTSGQYVTTVAIMDGMGHITDSELTTDPQGTDQTVTTYDSFGRVSTVTNPYRTGDSIYSTAYQYDALGRTLSVVEQDGSTVFTSYIGNCPVGTAPLTTVTDEAGKTRESCTDGLGRMTTVVEDPTGFGYTTTYGYDALDDLISVVQSGQRNRSFTYDSLSRLTQSVNPESGTINYSYDANGNLTSKVAPLENQTGSNTVTTTYSYDALNRPTEKQYNDGSTATVYYNYDGTTQTGCAASISDSYPKPYRTGMCDAASGSEAWSHDKMGRTLTDQRTTNKVTESFVYTYLPYLNGSVANIAYPSGLSLTYIYDGAGRFATAKDQYGNTYAAGSCANSGVCYTAAGAIQTATMGATTNFAGFTITNSFNPRLQPNEMKSTNGATTVLDLSYCFYGLVSGACPSSGTTDNGNVTAVFNNNSSFRSQTFTYDSLNRIATGASVANTGNCWGEQYGYDAWGNLLTITSPSGYSSCTLPDNLSINVTTANQISGYTYDAAGNLNTIPGTGGASYTYNAENQITATAGTTYVYDGDGKRVMKNPNGPLYWYGMSSGALEDTGTKGALTDDYIFFNGERIARRDAAGDTFAYFGDHLGTTHVMEEVAAGANTATLPYNADFYPFGRERNFENSNGPEYKFTGKIRDAESGLDDFGARYYSSTIGRFMSADWSSVPAPVPYASLTNPQTLNLYAMVHDNPETFADLDGHHQECGADTYSTDEHGNIVVHAHCYEVPDLGLFLRCVFTSCSSADRTTLNTQSASFNRALERGDVPVLAGVPAGPGPGELEGLAELLGDIESGFQKIDSPALKGIIDQLFKPGDKIPGGTAGAVRHELKTGEAVGGKLHSIKAAERASQLQKLANTGTLSANDYAVAKALIQDLRNALAGR